MSERLNRENPTPAEALAAAISLREVGGAYNLIAAMVAVQNGAQEEYEEFLNGLRES